MLFLKSETEQSIADRFLEQVQRYAEHPAIETEDESLTYAELNSRANKLANSLLRKGFVKSDTAPIALLFGHSLSMVVAILGVLKSGRAYLPLDPTYPSNRLVSILQSARVTTVLIDDEHYKQFGNGILNPAEVVPIDLITAAAPDSDPNISVLPDDVAYIFYTSGSTEKPKAVIQTHRNVLCNIRNYTNDIEIGPDDRFTLLTSFSFAASVSDLYGGLMNGATVCLFNLRESSVHAFMEWLQRKKISIYYSTPGTFRVLFSAFDEAVNLSNLRVVKLGGDSINVSDVKLYQERCPDRCILYIVLGATEINLISRYFIDKHADLLPGPVPVGYPPDGVELLLLDDCGVVISEGTIGNLVVRSAHISPGYLNEKEEKGSRIAKDPNDPNLQLFRTGDIGKMLSDGSLIHLGRSDSRVKINGQSLSLREAEAAITSLPTVQDAAVEVDSIAGRSARLIAYVVTRKKAKMSVENIRALLQHTLPRYMIPSEFHFVNALTYSRNGKLDRSRLGKRHQHPSQSKNNCFETSRDLQKRMILLWNELLDVKESDIHADFLEMGGDSIMAFKFISRIREEFGVDVSLKTFFDNPTPARLLAIVEQLITTRTSGYNG